MPFEGFEVLYETGDLPAYDLPEELLHGYGAALGFSEPALIANFVATLDGVVDIPSLPQSNRLISGGSQADRFLMGLLRACADAVLVGSGTLHGSPRTLWTPEHAYPPAEAAFQELRRRRGRPGSPELAVLSGSGSLNVEHRALAAGALVLTSAQGATELHGRLPGASTVMALGSGTTVDPRAALAALHDRGHRVVLSEAGPRVFGAFFAAGLVDELFLTQAPILAGRSPHAHRSAMVEGVELLPERARDGRLIGVRRHDEHLFLRYRFQTTR